LIQLQSTQFTLYAIFLFWSHKLQFKPWQNHKIYHILNVQSICSSHTTKQQQQRENYNKSNKSPKLIQNSFFLHTAKQIQPQTSPN
jgi:hypothetical protein